MWKINKKKGIPLPFMKNSTKNIRLTEWKIHPIMRQDKEKQEISMGKIVDQTTWKFLLVGIINTIVGTGVMFVCYNVFGLSYWVSSGANYVVGSMVSYLLNKYFTFQNKEKSFKIVARFVVNIAFCYFIAYGAAKPFVRWILSGCSVKIQENGAMLVGMCLFVVLNYFGQRYFAFRTKEEK